MFSDDGFLGAAMSIGRRIVDDAVWHKGRCSWIGAFASRQRPWTVDYRALGPSAFAHWYRLGPSSSGPSMVTLASV